MALKADSVIITDTVSYQNLLPGQMYQLVDTLIDKFTDEPFTDGTGKPVAASASFMSKKAMVR